MKKLFRIPDPIVGEATASSVISSGMVVSGIVAFTGAATYGVAYKKSAATTWNYTEGSASKSVEETLSGLDANTNYQVALYALTARDRFMGAKTTQKTAAEPEPSDD